jgi:hypothetical protein
VAMRRLAVLGVAVGLAGCGASTHTTTVIQTITRTPTARAATTSTVAAGDLCHGEASCGGYDNDPRDGQCGHAGQVACANVPWGSSTASQTATESPDRVPGALGVNVENYDTSIEANPQNLEEITADRQCMLPPTSGGVLIDELQPGGSAAVAGLDGGKPMKASLATGAPTYVAGYIGGDVIEAIDGNPVPDTDVLLADTAQYRAGDVVQVTVFRCDGLEAKISVTLEPRP